MYFLDKLSAYFCSGDFMKTRKFFIGLALFCLTFAASFANAQTNRVFPMNAQRGEASFNEHPMDIEIDGEMRKAAPGLHIWDTYNRLVFRQLLKSEDVIINYTEDGSKYIDKIWILTPEEAAKTIEENKRIPTFKKSDD